MLSLAELPQASILRLPTYLLAGVVAFVLLNAFRQVLFRPKTEPPAVFHWIPYIGSAVSYGMDPVGFFNKYRAKYGDIFTFTLFGRKITCYLGIEGNDFILNGKLQDINAEEIYGPLTIPVFGSDVVYDCPNSKLMEQKKFVKFGLTHRALEAHVPLIEKEVLDYIKSGPEWKGASGVVNISGAMSEITLFTAARSLQGREVRHKLTADFARLYHDLDMGFTPINFLFPGLPLPRNRRRDAAHIKMREVYMDIIKERRKHDVESDVEHDMIWNLMNSTYKNGTPVPDKEIAHMMITMLMGGQHSSSSAGAWIMLRLAAHPNIVEELFEEQVKNIGNGSKGPLPPLQYSDLDKLPLLHNVVKETLRLHGSIHSIMRKVMNPLPVPGTPYIIGTDKVLLSSPSVTATSDEFFRNAKTWDPHRWDEHAEAAADDIVDYGYGAVSSGTRSPYIPFGAGRHRCIGEKFAYLNLGVIIGTMVRNFKFSTMDGKEGVVPPTDHTSMFARPPQPSHIRWTRREYD
ncbi:14-alpha sterol demethylase Cyp51A [Colletotrichum plurivorum]|uniref:14-alpha sterol demethylase Cyp51A n=1 Tax=Colletotrichum plurivorum TaxID=2175906 RepID=A0A8H6JAH5_9PEZI|nr:14-alpha sterol demethylase Cyp51A [Colletotrichum plurivorum]